MVGGIIIGLIRKGEYIGVRGPITTVHVRDTRCTDTCCIDVVERTVTDPKPLELAAGRRLELGDSIWWQGDLAMWTPKGSGESSGDGCGMRHDIQIPRIGYTYASGHDRA